MYLELLYGESVRCRDIMYPDTLENERGMLWDKNIQNPGF